MTAGLYPVFVIHGTSPWTADACCWRMFSSVWSVWSNLGDYPGLDYRPSRWHFLLRQAGLARCGLALAILVHCVVGAVVGEAEARESVFLASNTKTKLCSAAGRLWREH